MLFTPETYANRRKRLKSLTNNGILLLPGNMESPMNYRANTFRFRQDSSFLYFFGHSEPGLCGLIDFDSGLDFLCGDDLTLDDIVWTGPRPTLVERALQIGISQTMAMSGLHDYLVQARAQGRKVMVLPPYRAETLLWFEKMLHIGHEQIADHVDEALVQAVISLRSVKEVAEIEVIERLLEVTADMHMSVMQHAVEGISEQQLAGMIEGIAISRGGGGVSFPVILSRSGQTLHNHFHGNVLRRGDLLLTDAGAESPEGYASDITRTFPVGGKFDTQQKAIYSIVLEANKTATSLVKPGIAYSEVHRQVCRVIAAGLKAVGLMKGDVDEAVEQGAHAVFFPHGLGHMLGLDVHDMENLGEDRVGYGAQHHRSKQFGTAFLRLGKTLEQGYVLTNEPGIYFIPELINRFNSENTFDSFVNYAEAKKYFGFGGIRIEDDLVVTATGCRVLGPPIPKEPSEFEAIAQ